MDAYTTKAGLWQPVEEGALAPLSGRWLLRLQEGGGRLGKRQDLPPDAFRLEMEDTLPVALSYRWLSRGHPDPDGFHLAIVCHIVRKRLEGKSDYVDVGLFWDFGSLYQNPRDPYQDDLFKKGLAASNIWYASTCSEVWLQPHLPLGSTVGTYDQSGWCFCEASISSSMKDYNMRLDIGQIEIDDLANITSYYELEKKCQKNRLPPLSPDKFEVKLRQEKQFTNGKEDFDHVVKIYKKYFDVISGSVTELRFIKVGWSADHLRDFAEALPLFTDLKTLWLNGNDFGDEGAQIVADMLRANATIKHILLQNNKIEDRGAVALAAAVKANHTIEYLGLEHNAIGDDGAVALADAIEANATLTTVRLHNNKIGDRGAVALAGAVQANATIAEVSLRGNKIGDRGAVALAGAVQANGKVQIYFRSNPGYYTFERKRRGPEDEH